MSSTEVCELCDGTGWAPTPEDPRRVARCTSCPYWDVKRGCAPGIPFDEQDALLDNFESTLDSADALKHAHLFLDGIHPDLYLWGSVGTRKTRLACSILNEIHKRKRYSVLFARVPELLLRLTPDGAGQAEAMNRVVTAPVVCLDDVGASQATDYARRMLMTIYDARVDQGHRTIWTSNLNLDELAVFLGNDARLTSRIVGRAKVVEMVGKDWRMKKARRRRDQ